MKKNDQSSLIGLLLIGLLILAFPYFFPEEKSTEKSSNDNNQSVEESSISIENKTSTSEGSPNTDEIIIDKQQENNTIDNEKLFHLENEKIKLILSNKGGTIQSAIIKDFYTYDEYKSNKNSKDFINIFNKESNFFIKSFDNLYDTVSTSLNQIFKSEYNQDSTRLTFTKTFPNNKSIEYTYEINKEIDQNLVNFFVKTENLDAPRLYWNIAAPKTEKSKINQEQYTGFYYQEDNSKDVDYFFKDKKKREVDVDLSWVSFTQQFFSTIFIAKDEFDGAGLTVRNDNDKDIVKTLSFRTDINNGTNEYSIYFGPNDYKRLKTYDKGFEEIIPLGWGIFGWVNKYIVINIFDFLMNNLNMSLGIIILFLTLIIKLILSPLTYKSYLSQAKMKVLKPEVDKINEKYKSKDPMKSQKETMSLYRKAGVNPLGGCLPMLVQFPILIAMFRFFPASIDMRQQEFLWADDLSAYDSIMSLPFSIPFYGDHVSLFTLLMTISTLMYTHMNMKMSSAQMPGMKWMMYLMPIVFLGVLNSYASSLSYYYFLANMFTFSQMYLMKRFVDEKAIFAQLEANKKRPPKPKSKFQKKLEEIQKKQEAQLKKRKKK